MEPRVLPPEAHLVLQIRLDKLRYSEEACRAGLVRLVDGAMSRDAYLALLERQAEAQKAWESTHRKYFLGESRPRKDDA